MKKLVLIAGIASLGLAASALAGGPDRVAPVSNNAPYVNVFGGVSVPGGRDFDSSTSLFQIKTGYDFGGAVGYRMGAFRAELQGRYIRNSFKSATASHYNLTTLMANGFYDINLGSAFVPFVGAGIGWVHPTLSDKTTTVDVKDNQFGYQGIAGVAYNINKNIAVNVSYTYLGWSKESPKAAHQNLFNLGLNYYFS